MDVRRVMIVLYDRSTMRIVVFLLLVASICSGAAAAAPQPPAVQLEELARGFKQPVYLTHDGTARRFIVEQRGTVRLIDAHGALAREPYLDITKRIEFGGECGLLGLAFHPNFAENGLLYINYTAKPEGRLQTVISRFKTDPAAARVHPTTEHVLLTFDQPYSNHNGGHLAFGPDGMLYIATGDGGSAADPQNNGQKTNTLLGKILRIDVNADRSYAVPKDNPFVGRRGYRPEIWATGLRNPWRFCFDRATGDCYAGDVGQNLYEEIDLIVPGGNYGWRVREASQPFNGGRMRQEFVDPIAEYGRDKGQSVTGGYVYRGTRFPQLAGWYLYADYASGRFWALKQKGGKVLANEEIDVTFTDKAGRQRPTLNRIQPASFGEDAAGELYVCDHNGVVYRAVRKPPG